MNIYWHDFNAVCAANGETIEYRLMIATPEMIMAERIEAACADLGPVYHEPLSDRLFAEFGGRQILSGRHGDVYIETRRGFD